jgi:hypothetical protein
MNWILDGAPGTERLAEYEARLNRFFESHHALGLCLYNIGTTPPAALDDCLATHPVVRVEGLLLSNPFYEVPEVAVSRKPEPSEVGRKVQQLRVARS